jgi:hypothetical protein
MDCHNGYVQLGGNDECPASMKGELSCSVVILHSNNAQFQLHKVPIALATSILEADRHLFGNPRLIHFLDRNTTQVYTRS